jgi:tetratricopeptide (TPR) repeat protein
MKVFISSTYKDLVDYRAAAIRAVEGTSYQAVKMEVFGARADEPLQACLKEVEASDLFIGIYAHRYGYVPTGADISITEMEYLHAKKLGRPIYCFVVDEEKQPWLPKWMDDEPGWSKLKAFKSRIQTDNTCAFFTSPADLGMKVANALSHYVANHDPMAAPQFPVYEPPKRSGSTLPRQPYFFGRVKELAIIADAISPDSRTWGALIDGPGGIGKTALAVKAANEAPADLFERKIFITAKVRELRPEGERPLTDFTRADYLAMLNELALELGEDNIPRLAPDERANALRMALTNKKVLIIFDNLETLHEDERTRLFQFLSRLPPGNKAIVTSRRRADVDARVVRVDRLELKETLQLIAELAKNNPRLARAGNNERRELYEMTSGNPLLVQWICGQLGRDQSHYHTIAEACALLEKAPKGNDPLEYIFGDLLETVNADETKALAALSHFTAPAKLQWISEMTGLPERAAETTLEDLADRSILIATTEAQAFFLPPLTAQFIKSRRPEAVSATGDALAERAYALVMQYGGDDNFEGFKMLEAEWPAIAAALPHLLQGENSRLQSLCDSLIQFLNFTGRWDERIRLFEQAEEKASATGDTDSAGWRAYHSGFVYYLCNRPAEVLACAARAESHWQNAGAREKAIAIRLRGIGYMMEKNYPAATTAYREALDLDRAINKESVDVAMDLNSLARAEHVSKDYAAAERDYRETLRIAKKVNNQEIIAGTTGNLAELALDREQWSTVESLALEALALAEKVGRLQLIANDCHRIAKAITHQGRPAEALPHARRAVEMYTHLRMQGDLQAAQKLLAEIEKDLEKRE